MCFTLVLVIRSNDQLVDISVSFTKVMLDLAGLYLMTEDLDSCQHQLMSLLKNEKENDAATIVSRDRAEI